MVTSKYLTVQQDWDERIRVMEKNLRDEHYDFLYFNIVLNLVDAQDNADYDREKVLKKALAAFKRNAFEMVGTYINKLKGIA